MNNIHQTYTLLGIISSVNPQWREFTIRLRTGDEVLMRAGDTIQFSVLENLDGLSRDRIPNPDNYHDEDIAQRLTKYLRVNDTIMTRGIVSEYGGKRHYEARSVILMHAEPGEFAFEDTHWWLTQVSRLADQWLDSLFGDKRTYQIDDFVELYRTNLNILGLPTDDNTQEMATLSRLIYGLSSAYLLTGAERYLAAATAGVSFQRETFRSLSHDGKSCLWAAARQRGKYGTQLQIASIDGGDAGTIPLYEQIYALAGLTQYYRITGSLEVLEDIRRTVAAFDLLFLDEIGAADGAQGAGGYFSHIDPVTMGPDAPNLAQGVNNRLKKNWNSIGDHIPAYLLNLILALEPLPEGLEAALGGFLSKCKKMLDMTSQLIVEKFPDPDPQCPYVRERFNADWSYDDKYDWQQDRAIIGHNLKIAWNLTRTANYYLVEAGRALEEGGAGEAAANRHREKAERMVKLACRLADSMKSAGLDLARGGCYDAVERHPKNGLPMEFPWESTKDFWQQEQCILAYLILHNQTDHQEYLDLARDAETFWNIFFLDRNNRGVFFRTYENGVPVIDGSYSNKAGHAIAGYHAFELNFLAHIYTRISRAEHYCLYFKPDPNSRLKSINVLPDFFKPGEVELRRITVNGVKRSSVDHDNFQIPLDDNDLGGFVAVEFRTKAHQQVKRAAAAGQGVQARGKIAVLIEDHFDDTEFLAFNKFLPAHGYQVEYLSRLWGQQKLTFDGNESRASISVPLDFKDARIEDYVGVILIGAYAMDRLRYEEQPREGQPNQSPAVEFLRKAVQAGVKVGTVCHSLWLFTAAPDLLRGRQVTCAHNLIGDVQNAGGIVKFGEDGTALTHVDGNLITGKHPGYIQEFLDVFLQELNSAQPLQASASASTDSAISANQRWR